MTDRDKAEINEIEENYANGIFLDEEDDYDSHEETEIWLWEQDQRSGFNWN